MEKKKGINFMLAIIAIIIGTTLYKHFNFETFSFKKPALDIIFLITFIFTVYAIIKEYRQGTEK